MRKVFYGRDSAEQAKRYARSIRHEARTLGERVSITQWPLKAEVRTRTVLSAEEIEMMGHPDYDSVWDSTRAVDLIY